MERDEDAITITPRKLLPVVPRHSIRSPVCRKHRHRSNLFPAHANFLAPVAAVFRGKYQLLLRAIVIALGPTVVSAGFQQHDLFGGKRSLVGRFVKLRPIGIKLVPPMLGRKDTPRGINGISLGIADSGGVTCGWRKLLISLVGIEAPHSAACFQFDTRVVARNLWLAVF